MKTRSRRTSARQQGLVTRIRTLIPVFLLLTLAACGEQIVSTRLPGSAARNFLYHLQHGELADALTYWAPDFTPADARARTAAALARLEGAEIAVTKTDSTHNADGSVDVLLRGRVRCQSDTWQEDQDLLHARLIMHGPGWRLTEFSLMCCKP